MNPERFSPGVRPEVREQRGRELDQLAAQEVRLSGELGEDGQADQARLAELFALASSTAEVRAAAIPSEQVDAHTLRRALAGEL